MDKPTQIEAEGGEVLMKNSAGDYVIIPKKNRQQIKDYLANDCHDCIDNFVDTLPIMSEYAEDGTIIKKPCKNEL